MSKILTLRGNFTVADNAILTDKQIFIYEAGDLTKGWEVDSAYIWPRDTRAEIGSADGQYQTNVSLATSTRAIHNPTNSKHAKSIYYE